SALGGSDPQAADRSGSGVGPVARLAADVVAVREQVRSSGPRADGRSLSGGGDPAPSAPQAQRSPDHAGLRSDPRSRARRSATDVLQLDLRYAVLSAADGLHELRRRSRAISDRLRTAGGQCARQARATECTGPVVAAAAGSVPQSPAA